MRPVRSICVVVAGLVSLVLGSLPSKTHAAGELAAYMKYGCWQCHGTEGQGALVGPRIGPNPMPYAGFAALVRGSSRAMPPYREAVLPEPELVKIHDYLKSRPPAVDTKRQLSQ